MIAVKTIAAFLDAIHHNNACCWASHPGCMLTFHPLPSTTLTLQIGKNVLVDSLLQKMLSWRFQYPDRYEGCYISMDPDGSLSLMCQPTGNTSPHDAINALFSLANID